MQHRSRHHTTTPKLADSYSIIVDAPSVASPRIDYNISIIVDAPSVASPRNDYNIRVPVQDHRRVINSS